MSARKINFVAQADDDNDGIQEFLYKVLVVGDIGTGKTRLRARLLARSTSPEHRRLTACCCSRARARSRASCFACLVCDVVPRIRFRFLVCASLARRCRSRFNENKSANTDRRSPNARRALVAPPCRRRCTFASCACAWPRAVSQSHRTQHHQTVRAQHLLDQLQVDGQLRSEASAAGGRAPHACTVALTIARSPPCRLVSTLR